MLIPFFLLKHASVRFNRCPILHSSGLTVAFDRSSPILWLYSPSGWEAPLWIKSKAMASHNSLEYVNFAAICLVKILLLSLTAWLLMSHWVCLLLCCLIWMSLLTEPTLWVAREVNDLRHVKCLKQCLPRC